MGKSNRFNSDYKKFDRRTLRKVADLKRNALVDDRQDNYDNQRIERNRLIDDCLYDRDNDY